MKYEFGELESILSEYGYKLIEYNSTTNLVSEDEEGYKYKINLCNLLSGRTPHKFMKNPYAYQNVKLYLSENYPDYLLLEKEYTGCKTKMRFICLKHLEKGIQYNTLDNIKNNHHACIYCGCADLWERKRTTTETMKKKCEEIGVEFVGRTSKNNECYVEYICPKHKIVGIQSTSWTHFKEFHSGCPHCHKMSRGEFAVFNELEKHRIKFYREYIFEDCIYKRHLKFDFYIPNIKTVIEFNGIQHYEPVLFFGGDENFEQSSLRDEYKKEYCSKNGIEMVSIPYTDYDNIGIILAPIIARASSM